LLPFDVADYAYAIIFILIFDAAMLMPLYFLRRATFFASRHLRLSFSRRCFFFDFFISNLLLMLIFMP